MNHPSREEWMEFLYEETPRPQRARLKKHLAECAECQARVNDWRACQTKLSLWETTVRKIEAQPSFVQPVFRWALAAILMVGLGWLIGRFTAPAPDVNALRADIENALRASLLDELQTRVQQQLAADWKAALSLQPGAVSTSFQQDLRQGLERWSGQTLTLASASNQQLMRDFTQTYRQDREQQQQALLGLLQRAEQKNQAEHVALRRAVETVAVVAAERFQDTETQLGNLASYTQARFSLGDPEAPQN